jgi:hypothetical protein
MCETSSFMKRVLSSPCNDSAEELQDAFGPLFGLDGKFQIGNPTATALYLYESTPDQTG